MNIIQSSNIVVKFLKLIQVWLWCILEKISRVLFRVLHRHMQENHRFIGADSNFLFFQTTSRLYSGVLKLTLGHGIQQRPNRTFNQFWIKIQVWVWHARKRYAKLKKWKNKRILKINRKWKISFENENSKYSTQAMYIGYIVNCDYCQKSKGNLFAFLESKTKCYGM